jgi:hypothetical protein
MARRRRFAATGALPTGRNCTQTLPTDAARRYDACPFDDGTVNEGSAAKSRRNFFIAGVDGLGKRCRMGGSPGTKGHGSITERVVGQDEDL